MDYFLMKRLKIVQMIMDLSIMRYLIVDIIMLLIIVN